METVDQSLICSPHTTPLYSTVNGHKQNGVNSTLPYSPDLVLWLSVHKDELTLKGKWSTDVSERFITICRGVRWQGHDAKFSHLNKSLFINIFLYLINGQSKSCKILSGDNDCLLNNNTLFLPLSLVSLSLPYCCSNSLVSSTLIAISCKQKYQKVCLEQTGKKKKTECCGQVVNTPASYSGGTALKSRPQRPAILIEDFCGFPQSLQ
jgi:hypothetical protein